MSTGVRPFFPRRRPNPDRPTVWFVGRDENGRLDMIELELLPAGLPYMVPSWWQNTWGPFTKEEAKEIVAGRKELRGGSPIEWRDEPADPGEFIPEAPTGPSDTELRRIGRTARHSMSEAERLAEQSRQRRLRIHPTSLRGLPDAFQPRDFRGVACASHLEASLGSFADADELWGRRTARRFYGIQTSRGYECVKIARNTWLFPVGVRAYAIQLHRTVILVYWRNGSVQLNTGGYARVTTKDRLNRYLPPGWAIWTRRRRASERGQGLSTYYTYRGRESNSVWVIGRTGSSRFGAPGRDRGQLFQDGMVLAP